MYMFRSVRKLNKILFKLNKQAGSVDDDDFHPVDIALPKDRKYAPVLFIGPWGHR